MLTSLTKNKLSSTTQLTYSIVETSEFVVFYPSLFLCRDELRFVLIFPRTGLPLAINLDWPPLFVFFQVMVVADSVVTCIIIIVYNRLVWNILFLYCPAFLEFLPLKTQTQDGDANRVTRVANLFR